MSFFRKNKSLIMEFIRYAIVGGVSAAVDMAVNYLMLFYILGGTKDDRGLVAAAVAAGFVFGLTTNFILSNIFVFKSAEQKESGKTAKGFLIYAAVGFSGFLITELCTILGTLVIGEGGIWYLALTLLVKTVVLVWNYVGRKIFVYKGK